MIIEALIDRLFNFLYEILPSTGAETFITVSSVVSDVIRVGTYLFPMNTVIAIFTISALLFSFRLIVVILKTLWGILPVV